MSTLGWIPPRDVAGCPDESFRQGMLELMATAIVHPDTDKPQCYRYLTNLLKALRKQDQAERDLKRAGELAEGDAEFQVALGHCYRELGLGNQALDRYAKAVELEPANPQYWNFRGMARHGLGHHEDAREDYTRAIEQDPQVAAFWSNRTLSHYLLQAYQDPSTMRRRRSNWNPTMLWPANGGRSRSSRWSAGPKRSMITRRWSRRVAASGVRSTSWLSAVWRRATLTATAASAPHGRRGDFDGGRAPSRFHRLDLCPGPRRDR